MIKLKVKKHLHLLLFLSLIGCAHNKMEKLIIDESAADAVTTITYPSDLENYIKIDCSSASFNSIQERADSIIVFRKLALKSENEEAKKWRKKFFCAFPNSFTEMEEIFGFNNGKAAPLYASLESQFYINKGIFSNEIGFFTDLKNEIPSDQFYEKYINICIYGYWQADNIRTAFGFQHAIVEDTEQVCKALHKFSREKIKSVFTFIFDGPHPVNSTNKEKFKIMQEKLLKVDREISYLMEEAYNKLMSMEHKH